MLCVIGFRFAEAKIDDSVSVWVLEFETVNSTQPSRGDGFRHSLHASAYYREYDEDFFRTNLFTFVTNNHCLHFTA